MTADRTQQVVGRLVKALNDILVEEQVSYPEYQAAMNWIISVGKQSEWPLFLDVFFEHSVERVAAEKQRGSQSTIEGPYYIENAPELTKPYVMPMRDNEKGDPLVFKGAVLDEQGNPIPDALLDMWQADAEGQYSFITPSLPDYLFRGKMRTDENGEFELRTIVPAPYQIPTDGPTGELLTAGAWHAWRRAHLHWIITKEGYDPLTTQLFFTGAEWTDSDVANAVKPELLLTLDKREGTNGSYFETSYQFALGKS